MITAIIIYVVINFISLLFMLFLMITAPMGYEDQAGYHEIKKEGKNGKKILSV